MAEEQTTILNPQADTAVVQEPVVSGQEPPIAEPQEGEFDFGRMVGDHGALADNWREGLPESIRGEKCLDSIKTIGTLAQSYVHAQKAIGANKVAIPQEGATPEEWGAFYKALGRPDAEGDYKTDGVKLPEGVQLDDGQVAAFRKFAFDHGVSQKLFEEALAFDAGRVVAMQQRAEQARQAEYNETLGKLRQEFGPNMDTVVAQCNKAMQTFGLTDVLAEKGLLNNYTVIKALAGIGERISESRLRGEEGMPSANDPRARLAEIRGNPDDPFYKKDHPGHEARMAEVKNLLAALARAEKNK